MSSHPAVFYVRISTVGPVLPATQKHTWPVEPALYTAFGMNIQGKVALITGAAVRIGRAIAIDLAKAGMNVCLHYGRSEKEAQQTKDEVEASGVRATIVSADLNDPVAAATTIVDHCHSEFGQIDVLINNASIFKSGSLTSTDESDWDRHQTINLKAPFFLSQAFIRQLESGQPAAIINLLDWKAERPQTGHLAYTISKSGLLSLTKSLALELSPYVRVNGIALGAIIPPEPLPEGYEDRILKNVPLQRHADAEEVTRTVRYILETDFLQGSVIDLTGGEHL